MEDEMETLGPFKGIYRVILGYWTRKWKLLFRV